MIVFFSLVTGALGTSTAVAVVVSPACSQLVHTYFDRVERNLVSKATLKRWHDWGVGHPNWHPSRLAHRAKFRKVRQELVSTLAVACPFIPAPAAEIALLKPDLDTFLLPDTPPDFSGDTLTPPIVAPTPIYAIPVGGYPIAAISPTFGGGAAGASAPTGRSPASPNSPTTAPIVIPPNLSAPVSTPVPIAPITVSSTPISVPVPITPVSPPVTSTPVSVPVPITPISTTLPPPPNTGSIVIPPITSPPVSVPVPITPIATPGSPTIPTISNPVPITPVTPAPTPEPGSILLTLTGLLATVILALHQRKAFAIRNT